MKKTITRILFLFMLLALIPSVNVQAASKKSAYKAYRSWLAKSAPVSDSGKAYEYCLLDLDNDKVPELIGHYYDKDYFRDHYVICTFDGKKVNTKKLAADFRTDVSYLPQKGKVQLLGIDSPAFMTIYIKIYTIKKGKIKSSASGDTSFDTDTNKFIYEWKGKRVSKKAFDKASKKAFNSSNGKSFSELKYISKSKMKKKLK